MPNATRTCPAGAPGCDPDGPTHESRPPVLSTGAPNDRSAAGPQASPRRRAVRLPSSLAAPDHLPRIILAPVDPLRIELAAQPELVPRIGLPVVREAHDELAERRELGRPGQRHALAIALRALGLQTKLHLRRQQIDPRPLDALIKARQLVDWAHGALSTGGPVMATTSSRSRYNTTCLPCSSIRSPSTKSRASQESGRALACFSTPRARGHRPTGRPMYSSPSRSRCTVTTPSCTPRHRKV